jgi:hypothetical protein
MSFFRWLKWMFYDTRRCLHESGEARYVNCGMNKAWYCKKCGKCTDFI